MTRFSLPSTQADNKAAFFDAKSAGQWLAEQPQANVPAMMGELVAQIQVFNSFHTTPRERFKTIETLRKSIFAINNDNQRRFEGRPLPLLPAEQTALNTVRQLWQACAVAYLHCLRACLDRDPSIANYSARVAHRVLACLRMEQMNCYLAGAELDGTFWRNLHSAWASVEQLGVARDAVEDRLLGETSDSTPCGQYSMILMLHLARPFTLSRSQLAAVIRWFARWREQANVLVEPDPNPKSVCIALNLSQDRPIHDPQSVASAPRWLSLNGVLRKMRQRLERLAAGESPESLKLGSVLSSEACVALLTTLDVHLRHPLPAALEPSSNTSVSSTIAATGLDRIHRLLGGKGLKEPTAASSYGNRLSEQQIAVFGHVVREAEESDEVTSETWRIAKQDAGEWELVRPAGCSEERLTLKGLLTVQTAPDKHFVLATINSLHSQSDGGLCITAGLLKGEPAPLIAEMREKPTGKLSRHPAFLLPFPSRREQERGMERGAAFRGPAFRPAGTRPIDPFS